MNGNPNDRPPDMSDYSPPPEADGLTMTEIQERIVEIEDHINFGEQHGADELFLNMLRGDLRHYEAERARRNGAKHTEAPTVEPEEKPQAFPAAAWTGLFARWRDIVAPCTEAPVESLWSAFLVATGCAIGRNAWRSSPRPLFPNFYALLTGSTGDSRKSTVLWLAEELLERVDPEIKIIRGIVSSEGLYEVLSEREGVTALGYCDEFRALLSVAKRRGTQDIIPRLQSLHSCPRSDTITRREKSTTISKPFFSLFTATPASFVDDLLSDLEVSGGFLNRFLVITGEPQSPKPTVKPPTEAQWQSIAGPLRQIAEELERSPRELGFAPDAEELWTEFYTTWRLSRRNAEQRTADLTARTFEHVLKIALVYSLLSREPVLSAKSLAIAIEIGGWLESMAGEVFGDAGIDRRSRAQTAIIERLRQTKDGQMYVRELQQNLSGKVPGQEFREALKVLTDNDQVFITELLQSSGQKRKVVSLVSIYT